MTTFYYSIVQLVPSPTRDERLNVGVVVAGGEPQTFLTRFLGKREEQRLKRISFATDTGFIHDVEREMNASEAAATKPQLAPDRTWTLDTLREAAQDWTNTIQLTEPRAVVHEDPEAVLTELFREYVADPRPVRKRARDKRAVKRIIREQLGAALSERPLQLDVKALMKSNAKIQGKLGEHSFDYRLGNGTVVQLVQALSLEKGKSQGTRARTELDAIAWSIDDLRKSKIDVPISVVTIGEGRLVEVAKRTYEGLNADFVIEEEIPPWVNAVAARLIESASH